MYPVRETDENIGGGRSSFISKPQEQMILTIEEDEQLQSLKKQLDTVNKVLDESEPDVRIIIKELYFRKHPLYTMTGLVQQRLIHCSRSSAFRQRDAFLDRLCKELKIY